MKIEQQGSADYVLPTSEERHEFRIRRRYPDGNRPISFTEAVARGEALKPKVKAPAPRFHPKAIIPTIPEGMQLVKFHGEPLLIPARKEGEELVKGTQYTEAQRDALMVAERARVDSLKLVGGRRYPLY